MLTEESKIDSITILEDNKLEIRRADIVLRDGVEIAKTFHRHVLSPGDSLVGQDAKVILIATTLWYL